MFTLLDNVSTNLSHMYLRDHIEAYMLDGNQHIATAQGAAVRASALDKQWTLANPNSDSYFGVIGNIILFSRGLTSLLGLGAGYLQEKYHITAINLGLVIKKIEEGFNKVLDYANPILNTACAVSYVAMIAMGAVITGSLGILGLLFIAVKHYGYMPGFVESIITPLQILSLFYTTLTAPQHIIFKLLQMPGNISELAGYLAKNENLHPYLPAFLIEGSPGKHIIKKGHDLTIATSKEVTLNHVKYSSFQLNTTACHAPEVSQVLPEETRAQLENISFKDLYKQIEDRCKDEKIDVENSEGWKKIKNSVTNDVCTDIRPANFDKFRILFKCLLNSVASKQQDFKLYIEEIAKIGDNCTEGWLREVNFVINPKCNNYKWMVHHELSIIRGELIKDAINTLLKEEQQTFTIGMINKTLEDLGGRNNVHLVNQLEAALWGKWRPYEAEVYFAINGRGIFERMLHRNINLPLDSKMFMFEGNKEPTFQDLLKMAMKAINVLMHIDLPIDPRLVLPLIALFDDMVSKKYTLDLVVDHIYAAIKPEYAQTPKGMESYRKIAWNECIAPWLSSLGTTTLNNSNGYEESLVEKTDYDELYLTKAGVRLLLWDMGIIETTHQWN